MGRSIYSNDGKRLLLRKGAELDSVYISRLIELGYQSIYVVDELTEDIVLNELIYPATRMKANSAVFEFHEKTLLLNNPRKVDEIRMTADDIIREVMAMDFRSATVDFPELKTFDNYLYLHSVSVAVLGVIIGWKLGVNDKLLHDFTLGALLHDIGKIEVPREILFKTGPLSNDEFEIMKKHSRGGFQLLSKSLYIKPTAFTIALQHHEAYDGSGYPNERKGEEIHQFSRIASAVDIFDALTTDRPYKKRWSFPKTLDYMNNKIKNRLDPKVLEVINTVIPKYPAGFSVKLSTGETGVVISNKPTNSYDPKVRVTKDTKGTTLTKSSAYEINLGENPDIKITGSAEENS